MRHGTLTLFAALNCLDGRIISRTAARHTHQDWLRFLKQIDKETPPDLTLHLIVDNYATHKHEAVKRRLTWRNARRPRSSGAQRLVLHFCRRCASPSGPPASGSLTLFGSPTSSSWMNLIERFFRDLTDDVIREGSFASVGELRASIEASLAQRDIEPKRYIRRAQGADIPAKNPARPQRRIKRLNI